MLSTIGYEGARPDDFLRTLAFAGVDFVVDVRDRAQSRRRGFSKTALQQSLAESGIGYLHLRELGDPKDGREAARAGEIEKFQAIFRAVLETSAARKAVQEIIQICESRSVCLLCYERDPAHCHRTMVAGKIEILTGIKARNLGVRAFEPAEARKRQVRNPCEGAAS